MSTHCDLFLCHVPHSHWKKCASTSVRRPIGDRWTWVIITIVASARTIATFIISKSVPVYKLLVLGGCRYLPIDLLHNAVEKRIAQYAARCHRTVIAIADIIHDNGAIRPHSITRHINWVKQSSGSVGIRPKACNEAYIHARVRWW